MLGAPLALLPLVFLRCLQGPQRNQQLLGSNQGLHGRRCGEREVDDLGTGRKEGEGQVTQRSKAPSSHTVVPGTGPSSLQPVPRPWVMLTGTWVLSAQEVVKISPGLCIKITPN